MSLRVAAIGARGAGKQYRSELWFWLILWLASGSAVAGSGKVFKIEVLVFAQDYYTTEKFNDSQSRIEWPRRVSELSSYRPASKSLQGIYARLKRSRHYRPLLHEAWTQSVPANSLSAAVHLTDPSGIVDGFFRLQRGHNLYMITDVEYHPGGTVFRQHEKRRFKLNEIHYLDHPKFGLIVQVSPL